MGPSTCLTMLWVAAIPALTFPNIVQQLGFPYSTEIYLQPEPWIALSLFTTVPELEWSFQNLRIVQMGSCRKAFDTKKIQNWFTRHVKTSKEQGRQNSRIDLFGAPFLTCWPFQLPGNRNWLLQHSQAPPVLVGVNEFGNLCETSSAPVQYSLLWASLYSSISCNAIQSPAVQSSMHVVQN